MHFSVSHKISRCHQSFCKCVGSLKEEFFSISPDNVETSSREECPIRDFWRLAGQPIKPDLGFSNLRKPISPELKVLVLKPMRNETIERVVGVNEVDEMWWQ